MMESEAAWIGERLAESSYSSCLNIGSASEEFRTVRKPHIDRYVFAPLRDRGVDIIHQDMATGLGVDAVGDILDPSFSGTLDQAELVICSNVIEHIPPQKVDVLVATIKQLVAPRGHLIVTAPTSYPYHADPIDNLLRPTVKQLQDLVGWPAAAYTTISGPTYGQQLISGPPAKSLKRLARCAMPYPNPNQFRNAWDSLRWLRTPMTASCVMFENPAVVNS